MTLSAAQLASLVTKAKLLLRITGTDEDALLELLIAGTLKRIETGLKRDFTSNAYSELHRTPLRVLTLTQPQVTSVGRVMVDTVNGLTVRYDGADTNATVEVKSGMLLLVSRGGGVVTTTEIAFIDEGDSSPFGTTTTDVVTQVNLVSGWTATLKEDRPSGDLVLIGAQPAGGVLRTLECWVESDIEYDVEYPEGQVHLVEGLPVWPAGRHLRVDYTAGPASIPADVELALLEAIKFAWNETNRDSTLQSEKLGDYSYTLASGDGSNAASRGAAMAIDALFTTHARALP